MVMSIVDIIQELRGEGISVLFTTHNRFFLESWADSVAVLKNGQIIFDGPTDEALRNSAVLEQIGNWDRLKERMKSSRE
jgi:ABC-type multidrug transport system ATPase subunit